MAKRTTKVRPGQTKTVKNPGGGSTKVKNGREGDLDVKIKPPKR